MEENNRYDTLGRLEDLPQSYRDQLTQRNLVPLWPSLRGVLPPHIPTRKTQTTHWPYREIRELLIQAGELTPIEKAERRVLVLANPGHGLTNMQASAAMYLGMQLLPEVVSPRPMFWRMKYRSQWAAIEGAWKYLKLDEHEFLFNIDDDARERANLALRYPERLDALRQKYVAWAATMPGIPDDANFTLVYGPATMACASG